MKFVLGKTVRNILKNKCITFFLNTVYIQTLGKAHNSQVQGLNLRCEQSLGGKRTVDINDEQRDGFLDEI